MESGLFHQLMDAIGDQNVDKVASLAKAGKNLNCKDEFERTPLLLACDQDNLEIVEVLISYGADVNQQARCGFTPLHMAIDKAMDDVVQSDSPKDAENVEIIACLLQNGGASSTAVKNDKGNTPMDIARRYESNRIISLLRQYSRSVGGS